MPTATAIAPSRPLNLEQRIGETHGYSVSAAAHTLVRGAASSLVANAAWLRWALDVHKPSARRRLWPRSVRVEDLVNRLAHLVPTCLPSNALARRQFRRRALSRGTVRHRRRQERCEREHAYE